MLEADHFGCVLCRYLGTVGERDIYEILIGSQLVSMSWDELGRTPGIELKSVSFLGDRVVAYEKNGYRVELDEWAEKAN
jgi:hypothetical protein